MAKTPSDAEATMIENLADKTGRTLEQWQEVVRAGGLSKHGEIVAMLKGEHGVGHGYANLIAHRFLETQSGGPAASEDLVAAQYAGAKSALKPLYDRLIAFVSQLGPDVEIAPKKTYVSLRRSKQFALIQPSTATRLDLGLNLKGVPPSGRLEASGSFNAMVSHRVRLAAPKDVDADVEGWLRKAYEAS